MNLKMKELKLERLLRREILPSVKMFVKITGHLVMRKLPMNYKQTKDPFWDFPCGLLHGPFQLDIRSTSIVHITSKLHEKLLSDW